MKKILKKKNTNDKIVVKKEKKIVWKSVLNIILCIAIFFVSLLLIFALYIVLTSPDFEKKELYQTEPSIFYDINGNEFARVGAEDSDVISYNEIPNVLIDALVATEDSRFFQHNGLDLFRFLKATLKILTGSEEGGASTLSMQVIKNTYTQKGQLEHNKIKTLIRKFRDIYMAVFKLEANYTKEEIIEFYFNSQWFANSPTINTSGTYGIERASQYYFGKSAKDVNLAEASMMVGMFQNPRLYNPYRNPEGCRNRQTRVLNYMIRHGYITEAEKEAVLAIPITSMLKVKEDTTLTVESYQAFVDYVINEIDDELDLNARKVSLKVYTTFDPSVQKVLENVENNGPYQFPDELMQEGIAVTSTEDGSITALSGGRNYSAMGLNRATDINKQPGSTAKPIFDYAMYIEHISQSSYAMFLDEKTTYSNGAKITDYDNGYKGLITMRYALEDSRNIPALLAFKAVYKLNPDLIKDFVHSVGIDYGPDLFEAASIGGFNGVSPLELSAAYAAFARGGYYIEPYGYTKVINVSTGEEHNKSYTRKQVMEESTAFMINNILVGAYKGKTSSGSQTAGKTGTTNLDKDTKKKHKLPSGAVIDVWITSYSPSHSIALWIGYDQIFPDAAEGRHYLTSGTGGKARRILMNYLATNIHKKNTKFNVPKTVTKVGVELQTFPAQLCSSNTPSSMCKEEYFVRGTEPTEVSKRYSTLDNPTNGSYTTSGNTITLKWDPIATPDAISSSYLTEHFKKYYDSYAEKYYNKRMEYNSSTIGTLGYEIHLKNDNGNETYVGYTSNNSFVYNASGSGNYTFVVKSCYSIFKANKSSGLTINAKVDTPVVTPPVDDIPTPPVTTPTNPAISDHKETNP